MKNGYMKQYGLALVIEFEWKKTHKRIHTTWFPLYKVKNSNQNHFFSKEYMEVPGYSCICL